VVGVDVAPSLLSRARHMAADLPNVTFQEADARALPFEEETFGVVVFDSTLTHVPGPERALAEAFRVLHPSGYLAAFDGDYATTTVASGDHDPLQACVDAMVANSVHDRWLGRRLPALVRGCGFEMESSRSHGFVETTEAEYMLTIIDRGVDILHTSGQIGDEVAAALKAEARRRVEAGTFFGHISYVSLVARKPPEAAY
jgi:ubiquinone/menaquinone biosynthesis C-methylase UbiE